MRSSRPFIWPVAWLREARGVSRSGFHAWLNRAPSKRTRDDEKIGAKVRASFIGSARPYGAWRVWRDVLADGVFCGLHRIERLMQAQAFRARSLRRGLPKDGGRRFASVIAPNGLDREFSAERRTVGNMPRDGAPTLADAHSPSVSVVRVRRMGPLRCRRAHRSAWRRRAYRPSLGLAKCK